MPYAYSLSKDYETTSVIKDAFAHIPGVLGVTNELVGPSAAET